LDLPVYTSVIDSQDVGAGLLLSGYCFTELV